MRRAVRHAAILSREGRMAEATRAIGILKRNHPSFRLAHVKGFLMMRVRNTSPPSWKPCAKPGCRSSAAHPQLSQTTSHKPVQGWGKCVGVE